MYAYTGEFFFDAFSHCGIPAPTAPPKITGIGFSPYLYHGLHIILTDYFGGRRHYCAGDLVMSVQWSFRQTLYFPEEQATTGLILTTAAGINGSRDGSDPTGRSGPRSRRFQRSPPGATAQRFSLAMDSFNHAVVPLPAIITMLPVAIALRLRS